jgi:putative transcriptional regulator
VRSSVDVRDLREALGLTQTHMGELLGVHGLTVSKWERGKLVPSPHHVALMISFHRAHRRDPDIGRVVVGALLAAGVAAALYTLLKPAFEEHT